MYYHDYGIKDIKVVDKDGNWTDVDSTRRIHDTGWVKKYNWSTSVPLPTTINFQIKMTRIQKIRFFIDMAKMKIKSLFMDMLRSLRS